MRLQTCSTQQKGQILVYNSSPVEWKEGFGPNLSILSILS